MFDFNQIQLDLCIKIQLQNLKLEVPSVFPAMGCACLASRFETCWPALVKDAHGVVVVFNPGLPSHVKEIEMWHSYFVQQQQLLESQCLLIAHRKPGSGGDPENLNLRKAIKVFIP